MTEHPPSEFCSQPEAAAFIGFSQSALEKWRREGTGPRYYRVGRHIRYTYADLTAFLNANPSEPLQSHLSVHPNAPNHAQGSDDAESRPASKHKAARSLF